MIQLSKMENATSGNPFLQAYLPFRHQHRGQIIQQRHVSFHFLKTKILKEAYMRILRVVQTQAIIFLKSMSDPPLSWVIDYDGP